MGVVSHFQKKKKTIDHWSRFSQQRHSHTHIIKTVATVWFLVILTLRDPRHAKSITSTHSVVVASGQSFPTHIKTHQNSTSSSTRSKSLLPSTHFQALHTNATNTTTTTITPVLSTKRPTETISIVTANFQSMQQKFNHFWKALSIEHANNLPDLQTHHH